MSVLGIDPGKSGGVALLTDQGGLVTVFAMPDTGVELYIEMAGIVRDFAPLRIVVEEVKAMPTDGRSSAFKFGVSFGMVRTAAEILCYSHPEKSVSIRYVTPPVWQKAIGFHSKARGAARKRELKAFALRGLPHPDKITLKTADAVLLARYGTYLND